MGSTRGPTCQYEAWRLVRVAGSVSSGGVGGQFVLEEFEGPGEGPGAGAAPGPSSRRLGENTACLTRSLPGPLPVPQALGLQPLWKPQVVGGHAGRSLML